MIHWQESAAVFARLAELETREGDGRAALATVVRVAGSAYRRPGAKLLVEAGGAALGGVSGGCLEADVREVAARVMKGAPPALLEYDTRHGEDDLLGLGLGCRGIVEVFVQPATTGPVATLVTPWRRGLAGDAPFAAVTVIAGDDLGATALVASSSASDPLFVGEGLAPSRSENGAFAVDGTLPADLAAAVHEHLPTWLGTGEASYVDLAGRRLFVEILEPPPWLLVCGAGDDAVPLVDLAAAAGFRVAVLDHRPALLAAERFPHAARRVPVRPEDADLGSLLPSGGEAFAVVMTHSLAHDRAWARRLVAAGLPYVGLLGPRDRAATIRRALADLGDEAALAAVLRGPVGLDLGAQGPHQVAISIVAELLAVHARRDPRPLAERREPIHA